MHLFNLKAFLKQPRLFLISKKSGKGKRSRMGGNPFWKSIGLDSRLPRMPLKEPILTRSAPLLEMFPYAAVS